MVKYFVFFLMVFFVGCSANVLNELADKNTDNALIFDAKTALNAQQYDDAIDILTHKLSSSGQLKSEAREVLASAYAGKFSGRYAHRTISGGIGHNLPQEAPQAFAQAVIDVAGY